MATIEEALVAAVTGDVGVRTLIAARFFPVGGRQGASYPYATYQRISTNGTASLDAVSDLDWPRFQIDVWAETALSALAVAEALRAALDQVDHAGPPAFNATFQDQRGPAPDEETKKFGVSQDYYLWHERT